jgi:hypothetical protein
MLKQLTNTKSQLIHPRHPTFEAASRYFYFACALLAIPSLGCGDSAGKADKAPSSASASGPTIEHTFLDAGPPPNASIVTGGAGGSAPTASSEAPSDEQYPPPTSSQPAADPNTQPTAAEPQPALAPEPQASDPTSPDAGIGAGSTSLGRDAGESSGGEVQMACYAVAGDGPCEICVCESCVQQLDDCAGTPGCPEILACVLNSGCTGLDCYCGDDPLPACLSGQGNGPCRSAVLEAPGGREPDAINPSGGPASDAALAVSACSTDMDTCGDVCQPATLD